MEDLTFDNILDDNQMAKYYQELMEDTSSLEPPKEDETETEEKKETETEETTQTTEESEEEETKTSEEVGSEETKNKKEEEDSSSEQEDTSPNFYSSIAKACVDDEVFQNLSEDKLKGIKDADGFREAVEDEIEARATQRLTDKQKRIDAALNAGVRPTVVQQYEHFLHQLEGISEKFLEEESDNADNIRGQLIKSSFMARGMSDEDATELTDRSFDSGNDVEDAKKALKNLRKFYQNGYDKAIKDAEEAEKARVAEIKKNAEKFKQTILEDKKAFGEIELTKAQKQQIFDCVVKPVYTDEKGNKLTAIQKFAADNYPEFMKYVGLTYVLTDGYKSLDKLISGKVKAEKQKGIKELENILSTTTKNSGGKMNYITGSSSVEDRSSLFEGMSWDEMIN